MGGNSQVQIMRAMTRTMALRWPCLQSTLTMITVVWQLGIVGTENNKLPPSVTEVHGQSTLISSRPLLSCHLYPQNQIPMCLWPQSHPHCHNHRTGPPRAPVNGGRIAHSRANKKGPSKTVTLADAVQKTVVLSYKVLRVDVNREHGQIRKVSATQLKLRLEDLARVPPVGIIKGLLVWLDNCMLLHMHLHVYRFCFVQGANFFCYGCSGQFVDHWRSACVLCGMETSK